MIKHRFNSSICKSAVFLATLAVSGLIAESAWAKRVQIAFVSQAALATACKNKAGATSYTQSGGIYGCVGAGIVECNSNTKTCTGTAPQRTGTQPGKPSSTGGIFGNGILEGGLILGAQGPATTGSHMGTGSRPSAAAPIQLR
jgi:hypothetical protein